MTNADKHQKKEASKSYREALEALEAKRLDDALKLLEISYDTVASPNSLLLMARTLTQLGREPEAYVRLEEAIALANELAKVDEKYAETAESAKKDLAELSKKVALVVVQPGARVSLGTTELTASDLGRPKPYKPGKLTVSVRHADGRVTSEELDLGAGEVREVSLSTAPPSAPQVEKKPVVVERPAADTNDSVDKRTLAFVSGAIGVVGLGAFAAFTVLNRSTDARAGCSSDLCPEANLDSAAKDGSYQALAFVGLGVGVIGVATSTYFFVNSGPSTTQEKPAVDVALGPRQLLLRGSF